VTTVEAPVPEESPCRDHAAASAKVRGVRRCLRADDEAQSARAGVPADHCVLEYGEPAAMMRARSGPNADPGCPRTVLKSSAMRPSNTSPFCGLEGSRKRAASPLCRSPASSNARAGQIFLAPEPGVTLGPR